MRQYWLSIKAVAIPLQKYYCHLLYIHIVLVYYKLVMCQYWLSIKAVEIPLQKYYLYIHILLVYFNAYSALYYSNHLVWCTNIVLYSDFTLTWSPFLCAGYVQYIRFLYFESTVNNPVMHTFVYLLKDQQDGSVQATPTGRDSERLAGKPLDLI